MDSFLTNSPSDLPFISSFEVTVGPVVLTELDIELLLGIDVFGIEWDDGFVVSDNE